MLYKCQIALNILKFNMPKWLHFVIEQDCGAISILDLLSH